jgi:pyruvate dehydrogenase E2 component (dihydrolipoamide acetyltransferase)
VQLRHCADRAEIMNVFPWITNVDAEEAIAPATDGFELTIPDLGPSIDVATIVAWVKEIGDRVATDEPICRLAVNELQFEVHSTADGELRRILAAPGQSVHSGDSLAELAAPAEEPKRTPPAIDRASPIPAQPPAAEIEPQPPFYVTEPPVVTKPPVTEDGHGPTSTFPG